MKKMKKIKKHTTKPVGKAILRSIKALKKLRAGASLRGRKRIDLNIKTLTTCYASIRTGCKDIWTISPQ